MQITDMEWREREKMAIGCDDEMLDLIVELGVKAYLTSSGHCGYNELRDLIVRGNASVRGRSSSSWTRGRCGSDTRRERRA